MKWTKILICLLGGLASSGQQRVGEHRIAWTSERQPGMWEQGVALSAVEFSDRALEQRSLQYIAEQRVPFVRVYFFVPGTLSLLQSKPSHLGFANWEKAQKIGRATQMQIAELIIWNKDALLRIRDGLDVRTRVLKGRNPLLWQTRDGPIEIIHITLTSRLLPVTVCAKAQNRISISGASAFHAKLRDVLRIDGVHLFIRQDTWFYEALDFPLYFWFDVGPLPITIEDLARTGQITCSIPASGMPACVASGGYKGVLQ